MNLKRLIASPEYLVFANPEVDNQAMTPATCIRVPLPVSTVSIPLTMQSAPGPQHIPATRIHNTAPAWHTESLVCTSFGTFCIIMHTKHHTRQKQTRSALVHPTIQPTTPNPKSTLPDDLRHCAHRHTAQYTLFLFCVLGKTLAGVWFIPPTQPGFSTATGHISVSDNPNQCPQVGVPTNHMSLVSARGCGNGIGPDRLGRPSV